MANLTLDEYTLYHSAKLLAAYELGSFEDDMSFDDFCRVCWRDYRKLITDDATYMLVKGYEY